MFGQISFSPGSIEEYRSIVGDAAVDELWELAAPLQGVRVLHLSSPVAVGAVRGVLERTVPLLAGLGVEARWEQLRVPVELQPTDRDLRQALSGRDVEWDLKKTASWAELNQLNARLYDEEHDVVVVHHTTSIGLYDAIEQLRGRTSLRCVDMALPPRLPDRCPGGVGRHSAACRQFRRCHLRLPRIHPGGCAEQAKGSHPAGRGPHRRACPAGGRRRPHRAPVSAGDRSYEADHQPGELHVPGGGSAPCTRRL